MAEILDRGTRIIRAVEAGYPGALVRLVDDSARHAGHAGAAPGGQTHYRLEVVSEAFAGMNRVARSRAVNALLAAEFESGLHALNLALRTPEEAAALATKETAGRQESTRA
jgi:BolA protein